MSNSFGTMTAALACGGMMVLAAPLQAAEVSPEAREVLEATAAFFQKQGAVAGVVDGKIVAKGENPMTGEDFEQTMSFNADFAAKGPNHLAIHTESEMMGSSHLVSNGEKMYVVSDQPFPGRGMVETTSPAAMSDIMKHEEVMMVNQGMGAMTPILAVMQFMSDGAVDTMLEDLEGVEYIGKETVDGVEMHHLNLLMEEEMGPGMTATIPMHMWIAAGDKHYVHRISPDISEVAGQQGFDVTVDYSFKDWKWGDAVDAKAFAWTPPENIQRVDSFQDLLGPPPGGMQGEAPERPEPMGKGDAAPDFELESLDGGTVTLASHKGKDIVVLDFWATWCGPCVRGMPTMVKVTDAFKDKNVVFYAVNLREDNKKVSAFIKNKGWDMDVLMDRNGSVADTYGVSGIPHQVIIDKDGKIYDVHVGFAPGLEGELTEKLNTVTGAH